MNSRSSIKLDVQEKVKEIKSRQHNWMRERSLDISNGQQEGESPAGATRSKSINEYNAGIRGVHKHLSTISTISSCESSSGGSMKDENTQSRHKHTDAADVTPVSSKSTDAASQPLSTHYCETCSALMVEPSHRPMLIIPCGHSLCEKCAITKNCTICHMPVESQILNIMLHSVISNHHRQQVLGVIRNDDCKVNDQSEGYRHQKYIDYKEAAEEYRNKLLRCDVLEFEEEQMLANIDDIETKLRKEQKQIDNIEKEKDNVHAEIKNLQKKLTLLEQHKEEYNERCSHIRQERDMERRKIHLLRKTLTQLRDDVQKYREERKLQP